MIYMFVLAADNPPKPNTAPYVIMLHRLLFWSFLVCTEVGVLLLNRS